MDIQNPGQAILDDLAANGGGTYERETLVPFAPRDGFAVGIGGITMPFDGLTAEQAAWAIGKVAGEYSSRFVGTWLDNGIVSFDAVIYFGLNGSTRDGALSDAGRQAARYGQKAVYDFATGESIPTFSIQWDS